MADALSKAEFLRFKQVASEASITVQENMGKLPEALLDWIDLPFSDWYLAENILSEMCHYTNLLGYNK